MSKMADLALTIEEMLVEGHSMATIADTLLIPIEWVESVRNAILED